MRNGKSLFICMLTASFLSAVTSIGQKSLAQGAGTKYFNDHVSIGIVVGTCAEMLGTLNGAQAAELVDAYWRRKFLSYDDVEGQGMLYGARNGVGYPPPASMMRWVYQAINNHPGGCKSLLKRYGYPELIR